jgi:hypothetical protein
MRGGVLRHYGGTAFRACNNAVLLRMDEMPGENVGPRGRGRVHYSVDLPGYGLMGSWDGVISSGFKRLCGLGTALCRLHVCNWPLSLSMPLPTLRPTPTSPDLKTLLCRLYLRPRCACACPFLAYIACGGGAPVWGRAPRWNVKPDLTPPAAATLSRDPTRFGR